MKETVPPKIPNPAVLKRHPSLWGKCHFIPKMFKPPDMVSLNAGGIQRVKIIGSQIRIGLLGAQEAHCITKDLTRWEEIDTVFVGMRREPERRWPFLSARSEHSTEVASPHGGE